jgi:chaperonin GroEL
MIISRAIEAPARAIAINAGKEGSIIVEKVKINENKNYGFNADTEEYGDLIEAGVIDPAKVSRTALQNAASISGLLLTTECLITEIPKDEPAAPAMPPGGGMY